MLCIFLGFIAVFFCSCIQLAIYRSTSYRGSVGVLCSAFSRAHQGSTGGFLLLQRVSISLAVDSSFLSQLILDLYVFYDSVLRLLKTHARRQGNLMLFNLSRT